MSEFFLNFSSWIWLGVLVVCIIIEAMTMSLTTIWGAISSIPLIFIARTSLPFPWQILIFAVLTVVLIIFTRPFAIKKLKNGKEKTNVCTMVGEEVLVTKAVTQFNKGEVKAKNGVIWSAEAKDNKTCQIDKVCVVTDVKGNTLIIEEKGDKN